MKLSFKFLAVFTLIFLFSAGCFKKTEPVTPPQPSPAAAISEPPPAPPTTTSKKSSIAPKPSQNQPPKTNETEAPELPENCGGNFDCYETYYRELVTKFGIKLAFEKLKDHYPKNGYIQSQCHPLTHILGQEAIEIYSSVSEAYTHGDSFCWSGYYHGVMEGIVGKFGRNNFPSGLNTYCANIAGKASYSFDYFNCVHGLGHGVMAYSNNELFDSLKMCDNISGNWEQSSCQGGVFMENVIIDNKNHYTKYLKENDLLYPCNAVDHKYKSQCYLMQTSYILKENGGDFKGIFELCAKADAGFEATCWQSLGRDVSSRNYGNTLGVKNTCGLGSETTQQSNCLIGAVKDIISYYHSDAQAKELCAMYEGELKNTCDSTAASYYKNF